LLESTTAWRGFLRKYRLVDIPQNLVKVVTAISAFLGAIAKNLAAAHVFKATWNAAGPWR
jgi:hypothetical protein